MLSSQTDQLGELAQRQHEGVLDRLSLGDVLLELLGLVHVAAHPQPNEAKGRPDQERDPPPPPGQLVVSQGAREEGTEQRGEQYRDAGGDVEE